MTNPDGAKASPEALTLRAHQKQDVYCLGSLLDRLAAKTDSQSLTASNPDLVDFVGACQSGKDLDYIAEHKYLAQSKHIGETKQRHASRSYPFTI